MYNQILPNFTLLPYIVSLCIVVVNIQVVAIWVEFEMAGFDNANGSLIRTDGRAKRVDKHTFAISGTLEIVSDFSNDWQCEVFLFYSSKGNNQFVKSPLGTPKDDLCNIMDGSFKNGGAQGVADASDLPAPKKGESLCAAYKKGKYTVRDFMFRKDSIPVFLHTGYYKAEFVFSNKISGEVNPFTIYLKLY